MPNERPDDDNEDKDGDEREGPGAPGSGGMTQILPPDLGDLDQELHPEPPQPVISHIDNEPVIIGNTGRTDEQQAAVDAARDAQRSQPPVPDTPTPGGMSEADIDAVKDLPVDADAPPMVVPDYPDVAPVVGPDGKLHDVPAPAQEPDPLGGDMAVLVDRESGTSTAVTSSPPRRGPVLLYGGIAAALLVVVVALLLLLGGGGGDDDTDTTTGATGNAGATGGQAVAPNNPPAATNTPAAPAGFTANAQQLRNANVIATDLAAIYGACAYEITVNGGTDVEQSVSSSPAMMQAMQAAGYQGVRSSSRTPTPCQGLPYNAASVAGNARDIAAAQALFAAARTNYQALFPGFAAFEAQRGQLDEVYCQNGVFVPAGNIIAVACWMRKGTTVTGVFILLPPGSPQTVIDEARRDAQAFITRLDGVLR
jgi:hypothetical protein